MKIPKTKKKFCPYCRKHTEHKLSLAKKRTRGTARPLSRASMYRVKKRGQNRGVGNRGRYSLPPMGKRKQYNKKQTKKTDIRFECSVCKKQQVQRKGIRAKKVEFKQ